MSTLFAEQYIIAIHFRFDPSAKTSQEFLDVCCLSWGSVPCCRISRILPKVQTFNTGHLFAVQYAHVFAF